MNRRQDTSRSQRSLKSVRIENDHCSRVGTSYQADIPVEFQHVSNDSTSFDEHREVKVWSPTQEPDDVELSRYLKSAQNYNYPTEAAFTLLHWHGYSVHDAIDDLPNYAPVCNKWTKCEVRKFLKCIDSKPRKNFVEAKKTMSGRAMGEIAQMYYSIAAPFKTPSRAKYHRELINRCFTRAVRNNLITSRRSSSHPTGTIVSRSPGESNDPLEREFELHLIDMYGMTETKRLLGRRMLCSTMVGTDLTTTQNPGTENVQTSSVFKTGGNLFPLNPVPISGQTSSSGSSSQLENESNTVNRPEKYSLPPGFHYDHAEFVEFLKTPAEQIQKEKEDEEASAERLDAELLKEYQAVESRARSILSKLGTLKPSTGFPAVSYRWSKTELALVLMAMSKYGNDFTTIAHIIGSKTESFIRDFYNQARRLFPLDDIIRLSQKTEHGDVGLSEQLQNGPKSIDLPQSEQKAHGTKIKIEPDDQPSIHSDEVSESAQNASWSSYTSSSEAPPIKIEALDDKKEENVRPVGQRKRGRPARYRDTTAASPPTVTSPPVKRGRGRPPRIRNT